MGFLTKKEELRILKGIYRGTITEEKLPKKLYEATYKELSKGVNKGAIGGGKALKAELKENINFFSAAKTHTQIKDVRFSMFENGKNGKKIPFKDFKEIAKQKMGVYNGAYLDAEVETAIGQAQ